ncbi:MAG: hypothetical protein V3T83_14970 [Acidobacteriota bacterium]
MQRVVRILILSVVLLASLAGGLIYARERAFQKSLGDTSHNYSDYAKSLQGSLRRQWEATADWLGRGGLRLKDISQIAFRWTEDLEGFARAIDKLTDDYETGRIDIPGLEGMYRRARDFDESGRHDLANGHLRGEFVVVHGAFEFRNLRAHVRQGDEEYRFTLEDYALGEPWDLLVQGGFHVRFQLEVQRSELQFFFGNEFTFLEISGEGRLRMAEERGLVFTVAGSLTALDLPVVRGVIAWNPDRELYAELNDAYVPVLPALTNVSLDLAALHWDMQRKRFDLYGQWTRSALGAGAYQGLLEGGSLDSLLGGLSINRILNQRLESAGLAKEFRLCSSFEIGYGELKEGIRLLMQTRGKQVLSPTLTLMELTLQGKSLEVTAPRSLRLADWSSLQAWWDVVNQWKSGNTAVPTDFAPGRRSCFAFESRQIF